MHQASWGLCGRPAGASGVRGGGHREAGSRRCARLGKPQGHAGKRHQAVPQTQLCFVGTGGAHLEDQHGVGGDDAAGAALAVAQVRGDGQLALLADAHALDSLVPAAGGGEGGGAGWPWWRIGPGAVDQGESRLVSRRGSKLPATPWRGGRVDGRGEDETGGGRRPLTP